MDKSVNIALSLQHNYMLIDRDKGEKKECLRSYERVISVYVANFRYVETRGETVVFVTRWRLRLK